MKFKKRLSKERISLLTPEDKAIYEKEWPTKPKKSKWSIFSKPDNINENSQIAVQTITEENQDVVVDNSKELARKIVEEEMNNLYYEIYSDIIPQSEYNAFVESVLNSDYKQQVVVQPLDEAEGQDAYAWIRGIPWIGKMAAAGLGLLGTGLTALIVAGKDKLAIEKLKYFMNRLVELTDQGIHKKRPWYSFLFRKKHRENMGEYNMGCFRMIQETADRNMTNTVMQAAHRLGYFATGDMMQISNGEGPQIGSGLDMFNQNVLSQINRIL